jgi:hypothetical protein
MTDREKAAIEYAIRIMRNAIRFVEENDLYDYAIVYDGAGTLYDGESTLSDGVCLADDLAAAVIDLEALLAERVKEKKP